MDRTRFEKPVEIFVGLGFQRPVRSAMEAYKILSDMPGTSRAKEIALKACRAAIAGEIEPETARAAFVTFARRNDILAPAMQDAIVDRAHDGSYQPGR